MTRWPHPTLLLASLVGLACASGNNRPAQPPPPPLTDPFTAPVSSAVVQKVASCKQPEDCGAPAAGIAWECRLGACTPTSSATKEPPTEAQPAAEAPPPPLPDLEPSKAPAAPPDRSTLPPGLFAPSPSPAPISPSPVEPPPTPSPPPAAPPPAPPPPAAPAPAPPATPAPANPSPSTPPPSTPPPG